MSLLYFLALSLHMRPSGAPSTSNQKVIHTHNYCYLISEQDYIHRSSMPLLLFLFICYESCASYFLDHRRCDGNKMHVKRNDDTDTDGRCGCRQYSSLLYHILFVPDILCYSGGSSTAIYPVVSIGFINVLTLMANT